MSQAHRLLVTIEEASPGVIRSAGAGTQLEWGLAESPFGLCSIAWSARGVWRLAFPDPVSDASDAVHASCPHATLSHSDRGAEKRIREIFLRKTAGRITVLVEGTAFQVKVWRALLLIPRGSVASYSRIASAAGHPGAARAVGSACGANPVAWLIPCHRAVRTDGGVGGYRWGAERKAAMLAAESARGCHQRNRQNVLATSTSIRFTNSSISMSATIQKIDHLGIAVKSLEVSRAYYEKTLGLTGGPVEEVPSQKVRTVFFACGEVHLELLEPTDPESPIAKFIEAKGEGIHHIAFATDDIAGQLAQAKESGARLIHEVPFEGAGGKLVAFLHPKSSFGVLTEFCQPKPCCCNCSH